MRKYPYCEQVDVDLRGTTNVGWDKLDSRLRAALWDAPGHILYTAIVDGRRSESAKDRETRLAALKEIRARRQEERFAKGMKV